LSELLHHSRVRYTRLVGRDPVIDEAKRAVMLRVGCSPDDAFEVLRSVSQRRNVKLTVVAREVVDSTANRPTVRRAG
jgi:AmiR/NasT family two-component response regulator